MNTEHRSHSPSRRSLTRILALVSMVAIVLAGVAPYMSDAQESTPAATPATDQLAMGEKIFGNVCIACHQPGGAGVPGIFPNLAGNPLVTLDDPTYVITTVLNGRGGMPRFAGTYDDEQVAAIVSYIRGAWGNTGAPVTADEVAKVRADTSVIQPTGVATPDGQVPRGKIPSTPDIATPAAGTPAAGT
ncbi:MAG: c-type cytochrome [Thermomicrobiales bacterium]